ncbi:MAG: 3-methyl-2-oxobutanoate hydroxymethyltransferase [Pseudomonadota bacterium]
MSRKTIIDIKNMKAKTPVVVLTSYNALTANLFDKHVDILLVGDSLGMVYYGMESTLPVSLEMMIMHGKAVVKSSDSALVVVDMPFGSYQGSFEAAFNSCAKILKETGCHAIKIEGGVELADTIKFLTDRGIPVVAHIALMPQYVNAMGGYKYRGRSEEERAKIIADAIAVEKAGAFAVVLEGLEESLASEITKKLAIITIGIGASVDCDGQVLVAEDMLGMTNNAPKFVKKYANIAKIIDEAVADYASDVRAKKFPEIEHCFVKK